MEPKIITAEEARKLREGANEFTLVDPGYHCGGSYVECSLASDCHGEHPTGRMSALYIDAGEEGETLYFAEPGDAALAAASHDLTHAIERLTEERDDLAKRLRNAEKMRSAFLMTSVAFATQEVDAFGQGSEAMRGTIAALVRALPIDPATMALIDFAITSAEVPRNA